MADIQVGNLLKLEIDGVSDALMFHKFDPPSMSLNNVTHNTWDENGNLQPASGGGKNPLTGDWGHERKGTVGSRHQEGLQGLLPQPRRLDPQDLGPQQDLDPELLGLRRGRQLERAPDGVGPDALRGHRPSAVRDECRPRSASHCRSGMWMPAARRTVKA